MKNSEINFDQLFKGVLADVSLGEDKVELLPRVKQFVEKLLVVSIETEDSYLKILNEMALSHQQELTVVRQTQANFEAQLRVVAGERDEKAFEVEQTRLTVVELEQRNEALAAVVDQLQVKSQAQSVSLEQKSTQLDCAASEISVLEGRVESLSAVIDQKNSDLESHQRRLTALTVELDQVQAKSQAQSVSLEQKSTQLDCAASEISVLEGRVESLSAVIDQKNSDLESHQSRIGEIEVDKRNLENSIQATAKNLAAESLEVARLSDELGLCKNVIRRQFVVTANLESDRDHRLNEFQHARFVGALAHQFKDDLSKELTQFIASEQVQRYEVAKLNRRIIEARENHEQVLCAVQGKLETAVLQVETLRSLISSREDQIIALKTQLDDSERFAAEQIEQIESQRANSLKESRETIDSLNQKLSDAQEGHIKEIISLKGRIQSSLLDLSSKNIQIDSLTSELKGVKADSARLKAEISDRDGRIAVMISDLDSKNQALHAQVDQFDRARSEAQQDFNRIIDQLNQKIQVSHLNHFREMAEQHNQVQVSRLALVDRDSKIARLNIDVENIKKQMAQSNSLSQQLLADSKRDMNASIDNLSLQLIEQKEIFDRDATDLKSEIQLLRYQLETAQELISQRDSRIEKIKVDAESNTKVLLLKRNEAEQRHAEIIKEYAERTDRMNELLKVSQARHVEEVLSLGHEINALKQNGQGEDTSSQIQKIDDKVFLQLSRADQDRADTQDELISNLSGLGKQLQEIQKKHAQEVMALNREIQELRPKAENGHEILEQMRKERDSAQDQLRIAVKKAHEVVHLKDSRMELDRLAHQLEQREKQLRQYAASLNDEKAEVLKRAKCLAEEIRLATSLNPLKDFLAMTEFELNKVEVQLRKTPMISLERARIEANFSLIVEQRDFLKAAIANSKVQLEHQAAELVKIARPDKLAPIPPLPPRS